MTEQELYNKKIELIIAITELQWKQLDIEEELNKTSEEQDHE